MSLSSLVDIILHQIYPLITLLLFSTEFKIHVANNVQKFILDIQIQEIQSRQILLKLILLCFSVVENVKPPGKVKASNVWYPGAGEGDGQQQPPPDLAQVKPVGKLNIKELFQNQEENNNFIKPKVKIQQAKSYEIFKAILEKFRFPQHYIDIKENMTL